MRSKIADQIGWVTLDSVFQGRIRTGTIVNLAHEDLKSFLNDAKTTSTQRLTNVLERDGRNQIIQHEKQGDPSSDRHLKVVQQARDRSFSDQSGGFSRTRFRLDDV